MSIARYVRFAKATTPQGDPLPVPRRATFGSFGYDLHANLESTLPVLPGSTVMIPTGLTLAENLPDDLAMLILPRSSLHKHGLIMPNSPGLIDADYTGEIKMLVTNIGHECAYIDPQQRLGQLLFVQIATPTLVFADPTAERAERGGFGSTGA